MAQVDDLVFVEELLGRTDSRSLRSEDLDVPGMNFLPRAGFVLRWILSSQVTLEDVEADVPTGGVARGPT
jgi:hypothetical protein